MKKYISEVIGTFVLVLCGTRAIIVSEISQGAVSNIGIAFTFGLTVMAMIYSLGHISSHFNPAVSFAFYIRKELSLSDFIKYVISQLIGALIASGTLKLLFPQSKYLGSTLPSGTTTQSFILEIILSFILVFVIIQIASESNRNKFLAGIVIGSVVLLEAIFAGPISGASMNPVRSFAPAIISDNLNSIWIYLTAPLIGAFFAQRISAYLR